MGRAGSDHDLPVKTNAANGSSHFGTLSIKRVDASECAYHIVECKFAGTTVSLRQKFTSSGPEDPEGQLAASCFALSTGSLPAFRAFLFENPELFNSGSACSTDQNCFMVFINLRKNAFLGLCFNAAVCRFQDGSLRSISFRSSSEQVGFEKVATFFHSFKLRSWLLRAANRGTSIACELENRRSDDITTKCKRCGELEFSNSSHQKIQQVSEDYFCSACLMMERKVIFTIRLEEQGQVAESWKTSRSETGSLCTQSNSETCCVCGCEDNEDLDDLVPCICQNSKAVVHASCSAACKPVASLSASVSSSVPWCFICGNGGVVSLQGGMVNDGIQARVTKRSMNSIQVAGGEIKRPRTSSMDGARQCENMPSDDHASESSSISNTVQRESKEPDCTKIGSAPRHGWRSADTPAVVPFKKRRLQISEFPRSPSPPPKPLLSKDVPHSPQRPLVELASSKAVSLLPKAPSPGPEVLPSKNAPSVISSSASLPSPRSLTLVAKLCIPDTKSCASKLTPIEATSSLPRSCSSESIDPQSRPLSPDPICSSPKSLSPKPASSAKLVSRTSDSSPLHLSRLPYVRLSEETASSLKSPEQKKRFQVHSPHCARDALKAHKEIGISNVHSSSMCANQLHSSSSQEVEDGELVISTEKVSDDFKGSGELPEVSSQVPQGHELQGSRLNARRFYDDRSGWDLNTNMETWDQLSDKVAHARIKMGKGLTTVGVLVRQKNDTVVQLVRAKDSLKISSNELPKDTTAIDSRCRASPCKETDGGSEVPVAGKVPGVCQTEGSEKLEADVPGLANSGSIVGEEDYERQGLGRYKSTEKVDRQASLQKTKTEDGIELAEDPEGEEEHVDYGYFDYREGDYAGWKMDDRSQLLEEETYWNGEHTSGSPSFWERNTRLESGEGERKQVDAMECSTSGRVRLSGWDQLPEGFESAEEALKAAQEVLSRRSRASWVNFGGRGLASSAHNFNSGRANKRDSFKGFGDRYCNDSSYSGESFKHTRGLDDNGDVYNPSRGRAFGRTGAGDHGRGCHNRWADHGQDDCNDKWGQGRHRSTSKFSSPRPTNAAALAVERSGFFIGRAGTRSSRGAHSTFVNSHGNRGPNNGGRARSDDMDNWLSVSKRASPRFDRKGGRSANVGMDFGERGVRYSAGTGSAGRMADRDGLAGHGFGDRYGGSSYSSQTVELRSSKSPDYFYTNYRRSPGPQPESRMKRSKFSPSSPERFSRSKFYPPSARNQRSPPPFSKFSHDKREGETFRERDLRRPVPRYGAPARTSPHVVHGSSLMDERDLQVLAGTRSSSGARGGLSSFRDVSPELQRSRRAEGEDHTGSMSKDSENGKNSPSMREVVYRRDRIRDDDKKREPYRPLSRSTSLHRRSSSRDGIDEVASRRQCQ